MSSPAPIFSAVTGSRLGTGPGGDVTYRILAAALRLLGKCSGRGFCNVVATFGSSIINSQVDTFSRTSFQSYQLFTE